MPDENPDLGDAWIRGYVTRRRKLYDPKSEFDKAVRRMCVVGYIGLAVAMLPLILCVLYLSTNGLDELDWPPFVFSSIVAAPAVTVTVVGLSLRRKKPWARKAAAVLSALGMAGAACLFLLLWIAVFRSIVSNYGLSGFFRPSRSYWEYALAFLFTMIPSYILAWSGWKLFFAAEYFSSREAKKICGETGGDGKGAT